MRNVFARLIEKRAIATVVGFVLIAVGLVLAIPGVPGPGLAIVFLGLMVLSRHYHWARRATEWVKRKWAKVWSGKQDASPPPKSEIH